jgi:hypothetical protein
VRTVALSHETHSSNGVLESALSVGLACWSSFLWTLHQNPCKIFFKANLSFCITTGNLSKKKMPCPAPHPQKGISDTSVHCL